MPQSSSYRPRNPGHNYHAPGIYHITLVTRHRAPLLSRLGTDPKAPSVTLTPTGEAVMRVWQNIPAIQLQRGNVIALHAAICMPDHFHGVIEVKTPMRTPLGEVIRSFKTGCTIEWRALKTAAQAQTNTQASATATPNNNTPTFQPCMAGSTAAPTTALTTAPTTALLTAAPTTALPTAAHQPPFPPDKPLKQMSLNQRQAYYHHHPELSPLWDDNYDDTICLTDPLTHQADPRHREAMIRYVLDNPRRAILRRHLPTYMQRRLHITLAGRDYAAFGNLFLLRWVRKVQVFCHRKAPDRVTPYEHTAAFLDDCRRWKAMVMEGDTVIITPGISKGEKIIKDRCIEKGYPLIHLQKDPIGPYWKPEKKRFDACASGSLLILAPWHADEIGDYNGVPSHTDYSTFHNLNTLASELCTLAADAPMHITNH